MTDEKPTRFLELLEQLPDDKKARAMGYLQHCMDREAAGRPHPMAILIYADPEAAIKIAAGDDA